MRGWWGAAVIAALLALPAAAAAAEYRDWDESEVKVVSRALAGAVRTTAGEGTATRAVISVTTAGGPEATVAERDPDGWFAFELPLAGLDERDHHVFVKLYDDHGLIAIAPYRTFTVDATPPVLQFDPIRRYWRPADAPIAVSWEVEPGASTTCSFGLAAAGAVTGASPAAASPLAGMTPAATASPPAPCDRWYSVPAFSDGAYALTVVATDEAGNARSYAQPLTFDNTPPRVTLGGGPDEGALSGRRSAGFAIELVDANPAPPVCALDGFAVFCGARLDVADLVDGPHGATVTVTDLAGNTTTVARDWTVDATAPWLTLDGPADGAQLPAGPVAYTAAAVDASPLTLTCRWDDAAPSVCGNRFERTLAAGEHRFEATATDAAGNVRALARTVVVEATTGPGETPPGELPPPPGGDGRPPLPATPPDAGAGSRPPAARLLAALSGPRRVTAAALRRGIPLAVRCSHACRGTLRLRRGSRTLARLPVSAGAAAPARVTVRLPRGQALPRRARLVFALAVKGEHGRRAAARLVRLLAE